MITSSANAQMKYISLLQRKASAREKDKSFVVEGVRLFSEVPKNLLLKTYISERFQKEEIGKYKALFDGVSYEVVADRVFDAACDTQTPQGVLAIVRMPEVFPEKKGKAGLYLILDGIADPGNLGTIFRTAEAAGVSEIIMSAETVDLYNPKVVRSTMGSVFRMPHQRCSDLEGEIKKMQESGIRCYATSLKESEDYTKVSYQEATAIVIGNEAHGVSEAVLDACRQHVRIPMDGSIESLNAAIASAVVLFEAARQRR